LRWFETPTPEQEILIDDASPGFDDLVHGSLGPRD
jgi:hypothetical protein